MKNLIIIPVLFCLMLATLTAQTATLSGKITRLDATPVSGITVELINTDNLVLATDQTNAQGMYSFEQLNTGQTYTVKPQDNGLINPMYGISTLDLVFGARYILGLQSPPSPFTIAAGDVNNNGALTTFDLVLIRKLILGIEDGLPDIPSYRFLRTNTSFATPGNPFSGLNLGSPTVLLEEDTTSFDFFQVKPGDINNP
ncbi:MAG: hypothetical protein HRU12_01810 [Phaeodactylibacter sp.]|nr:hypothetical protein [Phaeodactylibacter sp.]